MPPQKTKKREVNMDGARAGLAVAQDVRLSLDYNGLPRSREKDHGVGLTLDWQF
jgi:subtilase-type serine protease